MKEVQERNFGIDVFRGIAVLLVTGFHIWRPMGSPSELMQRGLERFDMLGFLKNGHVGVELFFIISGYCMAISTRNLFSNQSSMDSYKIYFLRRFFRIAIPYYIAIIFWNVMIALFNIAPKPHDLYHNLMHVFFLHNLDASTFFSISGVFWSIAVEMQFYLLLPLVLIFSKSLKQCLAMILISVFLAVSVNVKWPTNHIITWSLLSYFPLFLFGTFLALYGERIKRFTCDGSVLAVLFLLFFLVISYRGSIFSGLGQIQDILAAVLLGLLMFGSLPYLGKSRENRIFKGLSFIGRCSFSIYLYNYIVYAYIPASKNVLSFLILYAIVLSFGVLMYYIVEINSNKLRDIIVAKFKKSAGWMKGASQVKVS